MFEAASGLLGGIIPQVVGLFTAGKQRRQARLANQQAQQLYGQAYDYANKGLDNANAGLGEAENQANGRMAGAANVEGNIYGNQANTLSSVGRNATSASQALAMAGAVQGNTNNAFNQLGQQEAQNKLYQQYNVNMARQGVNGALDNIQNMKYGQGQQAAQSAAQLGQASQINGFNAAQGIGNMGMMAGMGAFGKLFGGGGGQDPNVNYQGSVGYSPDYGTYNGSTGLNLPNLSIYKPYPH